MVYCTDPAAFAAAMLAAGETLATLGRTVGEHPTNISKWKNGQRELRRDKVVLIAFILKIDADSIASDGIRCPSCGSNVAGLVAA